MARRSSYNSPPPPRAFMGTNESNVYFAIKKLAREQRHMAVRHITVEDMRRMFVPPHLREPLKTAFEAVQLTAMNQMLSVQVPPNSALYQFEANSSKLMAHFKWDARSAPDGFFVPRNNQLAWQSDVPDELREKFVYAFEQLARISYEFGLVSYVFRQLNVNGHCNTPPQMRYLWPAIRHLVAKAGMKTLADELAESSARAGDKARLPSHIAEFMVPTVNIVNRTILIDKVDLDEEREFTLAVSDPTYVAGSAGCQFTGMNG